MVAASRLAILRSKFRQPYASIFFNNNATRTLGCISCRKAWIGLQMPKDGWIAEFYVFGNADSEATEFRSNFTRRNRHACMRCGSARHMHIGSHCWMLSEQR